MSNRYFPATAMGGRLYFDGPDPAYCDETVVDSLVSRVSHRKVQTDAELLAVVTESSRGLPAIRVWIGEELRASAKPSQPVRYQSFKTYER